MKKAITNLMNYEGKEVFVGVDVHKRHYSVACICDGVLVKKATMKSGEENLILFLRKYFPGAKVKTGYEAGFSGFVLHRYLEKNEIENIVVNAASIEVSSRDRVKTDKRDAVKLAKQLASGFLKGIHVPSERREAKRSLSRLRETVMRARKRSGNQLKSFLYLQGLIQGEDDKVVSKKWLKKVLAYSVGTEVKYCIDFYVNQWLLLENKVKEIDKRLEEQSKEDAHLEAVYLSAPGIGAVHARQLCNELEDMKQFDNEKKLFSFMGLTPSEHSSGENKRLGHITRQGRSVLRKILTQAAWVAITRDESLKEIFERIAKTAGKKRAIIGIARRLIGRIRSCFFNGCLYQCKATKSI